MGKWGSAASTHGAKMRRSLVLAGTIAAVGLFTGVVSAEASAEVRTGSLADPQDAAKTISGVPSNPDIRQVSASYDSTGSVEIRITYYNAIDQLDTSDNYAFFGRFAVGFYGSSDFSPCDTYGKEGALTAGQHHVYSAYQRFYDQATVSGYEGDLQFTRTISGDSKTITLTATHPGLANRDYACIEYSLHTRSRSSYENLNSDYDEHCDCWYLSRTLDIPGTSTDTWVDDENILWLTGYPPPTAPPAGDNEGLPRLNIRAAKRYIKKALSIESAKLGRWATAKGRRINRCRRSDETQVYCRVKWRKRKMRYRGPVTIWYSENQKGQVLWNYSFRIKRTNRRCLSRGGTKAECTKTIRVT